MQCNAVQCSAVQCSAMQCSAMQCNAVQCNAMQCSAVQCNAMQCSAVQCNAVQCSAMQCNAVQCNAVDQMLFIICSCVVVTGFPETTAQEKEVKPDEVMASNSDTKVTIMPHQWTLGITSGNCREKPVIISRLCGGDWFGRCSVWLETVTYKRSTRQCR